LQRRFRRREAGIEFDCSHAEAIDQFGFHRIAPQPAFSGQWHGIGQRMDPMGSEESVSGVSPPRFCGARGENYFAIHQIRLLLDCGEMHGEQ